MTMRRLPPLETLRVFEAVERHKSFKEAGDELGVTASAVSHRIATLEEELGITLFVRHTRRLQWRSKFRVCLEMTMRRLPPLETLRVFEAVERHKSFKEAGDELGVTASAVSHRIATLEEELGITLFVRHTRRIEVTPEGERLAAGVRRGL